MRIDTERVKVEGDHVIVQVDSLNQAYTVAARRLQPERRSHSGRIYSFFLFVAEDGSTQLLERIRAKVEEGTWKAPESKGA